MKKTLLLMIVLIQMTSYNYAQWNNIYQDSTLREVLDLYFFNQDTGFVCGSIQHGEGFIMRTYDGGDSWQNTISDIMICYSIDFINDSIGYSGGQDGAVYKTIDGGITWNYLSSAHGTSDFEDLEFINDSVGFVKKYHTTIRKTTDGGLTWTDVSDIIDSDFYQRKHNSIHFIDDSIGFVVGNGTIYKTIDQGSNWQKQNTDSTKYYKAIYMLNENEGFAVGNDGVIVHSIDGGENWTTDSICNQDLRDIDFISDSIGFIVGGGYVSGYYNDDTIGIVLKTMDKGNTWNVSNISDNRLNSFQFIDSVAYTVGNYGNIFKNINNYNPINIFERRFKNIDFNIWPNPVKSEINFNLPTCEPVNLELIDLNGCVVLNYQNLSKRKIDISMIKNGLYIFKVKCNKDIFVNKVMINR